MARALGVGGIFFKSADPKRLTAWYGEHLGLPVNEWGASLKPADMPAEAITQWTPFKSDTSYFEPSAKDFMLNLVVDDLDGALEQVRAGGAVVTGDIVEEDYGRFGWFLDPDGNKVELWQPRKKTSDG